MTRAASTDGHNLMMPAAAQWPAGSDPFVLKYVFNALRPANWPAATGSTGLQSGGTATSRFKNCLPVGANVPVTGTPVTGTPGLGLPSGGPAGDVRVMAGAGVAAGPAPYVRHQPSGDVNGPGESRAC